MPRASLEFAATLYQEQNELLESMRDDNDSVLDAIYDAQKRYDDYVRKLSTQPEVVAAVPSFVNDRYNAIFKRLRGMWCICLKIQTFLIRCLCSNSPPEMRLGGQTIEAFIFWRKRKPIILLIT